MEEGRIKAEKHWPEPKSARDIQVSIEFANYIVGFSRIAAPLTSMSKTSGIEASSGKDDNIEGDKGDEGRGSMTVRKSGDGDGMD